MTDWQIPPPHVKYFTISDICKRISSGGTPAADHSSFYNGNIPWLRTQEINWTNICDTEVKISDEGLAASSAQWIPANCVIVAMYGATAAKVAINDIPLTTNQACCNLEVDETKALFRYVFHWLCKEYHSLKALGRGPQSNINAQIIKQYPIPVPELSVQQRIVDTLDHFDAICSDLKIGLPAEIEARQRQYEHYRDLILSFEYIGPYAKNASQPASQPASKKRANLSPDEIKILQYVFGYVVVNLESVGTFVGGLTNKTKADFVDGNAAFVTYKNVYENAALDIHPSETVKICSGEDQPILEYGDIIFTGSSETKQEVGYTSVVTEHSQFPLYLNSFCFVLRPYDVSCIHPEFAKHYFRAYEARKQIEKAANGVTRYNLSRQVLQSMQVILPEAQKQKEVAKILDKLYALSYNITEGLPAEIQLYQKIYEYYRDYIFMVLSV